jgi:mono/diheme cytochrome c family protein
MTDHRHDGSPAMKSTIGVFSALAFALLCHCGGSSAHPMSTSPKQRAAGKPAAHPLDAGMTDLVPDATAPDDTSVTMIQPPPPAATCTKLSSPETVPARDVVTSANAKSNDVVFAQDVFGLFKANCGGCHIEQGLGGFHPANSVAGFADATQDRQQKIYDRLHSDDPNFVMPPTYAGGKPWSQRSGTDPIIELWGKLDQWFKAGSPLDFFYVKADSAAVSQSPFLLSEDVASNLTNIGSCMPNKAIVGREAAQMDKLDAQFTAATELPPALDQTDLTTFDSETLALNGVISFAPTYPLFSDNARKMRHVRVPRGQSISFDKDTQEFTIPANTRFYKTFLKKIIDKNGNERYRKVETRLILSRPDGPDSDVDGSHQTNALFGSYAWNDDETQATLVTDPLRNGKPFRDRLLTYVTDEGKAEQVLATTKAINKLVPLREAGVLRTYAIPGSERCIQCHMGSHNHSFALGFTPLQIKRRATDTGGTYEQSSDDELSQMQRMIDYKLISGMSSPDDVLPLEQSQGDRTARNDKELAAQAYMLGNCAHCHNPRGFPTTQNPVLKDLLRFFPDRDGGIFQFPLDRVSPRIKRGLNQDVDIPYITPSLVDRQSDSAGDQYTAKSYASGDQTSMYYLDAPWRSLIYRNVDSPFTYADDFALFPHMPLNAAGFDCRAPRIMGDWMVSIPARLATPMYDETKDPAVQPYVEVHPGDAGYDQALADATKRLALYHGGQTRVPIDDPFHTTGTIQLFHQGERYTDYCPDTSDIIDPAVAGDVFAPQDNSALPSLARDLSKKMDDPRYFWSIFQDGVPDHAHWVVTDITDPPGKWYPRRGDWASVLVDMQLDGASDQQKLVVNMLQSIKLTDELRGLVLTPVPFGVWKQKDECKSKLAAQPKVSDFTGSARPQWFDFRSGLQATDALYMQAPGASVFNEICINCHGPKFDSRGRQADTIMMMTGGETRVANLRDGLFGPVDNPGANRQDAFGPSATADVTFDDWAARYVAWMGLGGTQRVIPAPVVSVISTALVLGEPRPAAGFDPGGAATKSANMLSIAKGLCFHALGRAGGSVNFDVDRGRLTGAARVSALVVDNGDAELWKSLCGLDNPFPVAVVQVKSEQWGQPATAGFVEQQPNVPHWYKRSSYPSTASIGDDHGNVVAGVAADNRWPWCVVAPTSAADIAAADMYVAQHRAGKPFPYCPTAWLNDSASNAMSDDELEQWGLRGAITAGMSVFLYLDQLSHDALNGKGPQPGYDHCEQLTP